MCGSMTFNTVGGTYGMSIRKFDVTEGMWVDSFILLQDREQLERLRDAVTDFLNYDSHFLAIEKQQDSDASEELLGEEATEPIE